MFSLDNSSTILNLDIPIAPRPMPIPHKINAIRKEIPILVLDAFLFTMKLNNISSITIFPTIPPIKDNNNPTKNSPDLAIKNEQTTPTNNPIKQNAKNPSTKYTNALKQNTTIFAIALKNLDSE